MTKQRNFFKDDAEHEKVQDIVNGYATKLAKLIAATLDKVPPELHDMALDMTEDSSSVHGSDYAEYLKR